MPSTYSPPDVIVEQRRRTAVANRIQPQLPVVVVGPARQIVTRAKAGDYVVGVPFDQPLPTLSAGAEADAATFETILDARLANGKALGLFKLDSLDAQLSPDNKRVLVGSSLALEYSILSSRNNNQVDTLLDDDRASGTPDGIRFTDASVDFLSRGASVSGDSFVIIDSPASMAGRFQIYEMIPTGQAVHTVKLQQVDEDNVLVLAKDFDIDQASLPTTRFVYGSPANHEEVTADNVVNGDIGLGVGVQNAIEITPGKTILDTTDLRNILAPGTNVLSGLTVVSVTGGSRTIQFPASTALGTVLVGDLITISGSTAGVNEKTYVIATVDDPNDLVTVGLNDILGVAITISNDTTGTAVISRPALSIPATASGDNVTFAPSAPVNPGTLYGTDNTFWRAIISKLVVGDWMRVTGDFGGGSVIIRDFKITAIDPVNFTVAIENPDFTGTTSYTFGLAAITGADVTAITFLKVLKGRDDGINTAGDYVTGEALGVPFEIEILSARPAFIELVSNLPTLSAVVPTNIVLRRGVAYRNATASYNATKRLVSGFSGSVLVSYEADRVDLPLNGLMEISDRKSYEDLIGIAHPNNKLALMCDMVIRTGLTDGNRLFFALATNGDTLDAHEEALDALTTEDVYYVVPATQDPDIISLYKSHVDVQSQPVNKHERVLLASTALVTTDRQVPTLDTDVHPQGYVNANNTQEFISAAIDWTLVNAGDVLKIMSAASQATAVKLGEYRIQSVDVANTKATLLDLVDPDFVGTILVPKLLFVRIDTFPYTKGQQAEDWRDYAKAIKDFRVMIIRPDEAEIQYTDKTGPVNRDQDIIVPMYYGCASFAGLAAGLPPQQPMTNMPVPGINRLFHSNFYFTPDQLNTIAEGGNNILVQTTRTAAPYSRHQLMTDTTSLVTQEFSIVKLVDYACKYIRNSLRPYIGNHNITTEFLTQLRGIAESVLRSLVQSDVLLQGTTLDSLEQDKDSPDTVNITISFQVPYPCNKIRVTVYI